MVAFELTQIPEPGKRLVQHCGDTLTVALNLSQTASGTACLRTNLGHARMARHEIIHQVDHDETPLGKDWYDIPMRTVDAHRFEVRLPLAEVGHFEAKCLFVPTGETEPIWPAGPNLTINVEPADTVCSNSIYNAFVRQFGYNRMRKQPEPIDPQSLNALDDANYAVIPPSGKFRDLINELDFIMGELGCRFIQLLPVHPTPTTYGRMGRFGSPYAALSFTAIDPALAEFDPKATPLDQFIELVDAVHARNGKMLIDIAINHTGWAASLHGKYPQWLARDTKGHIEVPGAWGVRWEDLTKLNYDHVGLWRYMADVFLTWCRRGVDGFRCDAGYMIPPAAWRYMIARVRQQFPNTLFLLEGLGGKISVTRDLLNQANFNWAYSELFQNYNRQQVEIYLPTAYDISLADGNLINFAETHDNPRLAATSLPYAKMRTALCALCSVQGGFGFANGVEWYATEKINVHGAPSLNWGAPENQVKHIQRLNRLLRNHPTFHPQTDLIFIHHGEGNSIALQRHHQPSGRQALIVANLDHENPTPCTWPTVKNWNTSGLWDLLTGAAIYPEQNGQTSFIMLEPAQILCLTNDAEDLSIVSDDAPDLVQLPGRILKQRSRAKIMEMLHFYNGMGDIDTQDMDAAARKFLTDPLEFCRSQNSLSQEPRVVCWQWPRDQRRLVMWPSNHFLLIKAQQVFRSKILCNGKVVNQEDSFPDGSNNHFTVIVPPDVSDQVTELTLHLSVYETEGCRHAEAKLMLLPIQPNVRVPMLYSRTDLNNKSLGILATNGQGTVLRANAEWGALKSRYDALLAANLANDFPADRRILLVRCRMWIRYQGYSQEINQPCLDQFELQNGNKGVWRFKVPTGKGEHVMLVQRLKLAPATNTVCLEIYRPKTKHGENGLDDQKAVHVILRPDISNRNFHDTTKAYQGAEHTWPSQVEKLPDGFKFAFEKGQHFSVAMPTADFICEPQWQYMVFHANDAERGLDPHSDLFSPGYFDCRLIGGQTAVLTANYPVDGAPRPSELESKPVELLKAGNVRDMDACTLLRQSLKHYIVKRGLLKSVIAGYPWFLDWGRDALIFTRGLIAVGMRDAARQILIQFGQFELEGTLPNAIHGGNTDNRNTSDAPLWFIIACRDLVQTDSDNGFLETICGGRTIYEIIQSIIVNYMKGAPNGVNMDGESGLIFSPTHFSWMDTNHPAGSPREGYPIEIQALWYAALAFWSTVDSRPPEATETLTDLSAQVRSSIVDLFWRESDGFLADCLHTEPGKSAFVAETDDALRPNQLLAITLQALDDVVLGDAILQNCSELLVPGAIRSLADRPTQRPLAIRHNGKLLNSPQHPYQGHYRGEEDTSRKPAYHNGTAWTWLFPSFCEAYYLVYGGPGCATAKSLLASTILLITDGCLGHIPEIVDGDFPHAQKGCDAQAWGASEWLRVWGQLSK